jgi:hypothetical protein
MKKTPARQIRYINLNLKANRPNERKENKQKDKTKDR